MDNLHDFPLNFGINRDYLTSLYGSQNIVSRTIPITLNIDTVDIVISPKYNELDFSILRYFKISDEMANFADFSKATP